jgi:hypothetical protein
MIDPQLDDWWTRRHRCQLSLHGDEVLGAGASLRVVLKAFDSSQYVWYSAIFGDVWDEVLVVAVDRSRAADLPRDRHAGDGPVSKALHADAVVEEYALNEKARKALGVEIGPEYNWVSPEKVKHWVYLHDDCFFSLEAVDDDLLLRLIRALLEMHSFYLETEADWSAAGREIFELVKGGHEVTIESDPAAQLLHVRWREKEHGMRRMFRRMRSREFPVVPLAAPTKPSPPSQVQPPT